MQNIPYNTIGTELWLMYLRKSRADSPDETVEEVLQKHEVILQEWAKRELGHTIPEENIYREVVSGESIDERIEVKKLLARIEDPAVKGVIVVEPQRLSRGDLEDCGRLINDLRYTRTLVATPMMTYDLDNKMERRFFQDELLRGRDFLEYTKEILMRGRVAAVKRGCYIGRIPPYGYDKVKIGDDCTLEPNDCAEVVRLVFELYTQKDLTPYRIAEELNGRGIPSPTGGTWKKDTIRTMLRNDHYVGKVHFNNIKNTIVIEDGERKVKRLKQPDEEVIVAEGKHPAIIDKETWETAQRMVARNPRLNHTHELKNPLSMMLVCAKCGRKMHIHPYKTAAHRYECRTKPRCFKSCKVSDIEAAVLFALENAELPALKAKLKNDDGNAAKIQRRLIEKLEKQMQEFRDQEENQFELLETRKYTQELFDRRNAALRAKMDECQKSIYQAKQSLPESVDYAERVVALEAAIAGFKDPNLSPAAKNKLLKAIVDRIEYTGSPSGKPGKKKSGEPSDPFSLEVFLRL